MILHYPIDNWATIEENGVQYAINLFSDKDKKYLAIYSLNKDKTINGNDCIHHYELKVSEDNRK